VKKILAPAAAGECLANEHLFQVVADEAHLLGGK
jgi:hypothetical protein